MPSVAAAGQAEAKEEKEEEEKEGKESVTGRELAAIYNSLSLGTCTTHTLSWVLQIAYIRQVSNGTACNWEKEVVPNPINFAQSIVFCSFFFLYKQKSSVIIS